jgi:hypothetical protein
VAFVRELIAAGRSLLVEPYSFQNSWFVEKYSGRLLFIAVE